MADAVNTVSLKELATEAAMVIAGVWGLLKFIFEPRLHKLIEEKTNEQITDVTSSVATLEERMEKVERDALQMNSAVHQIAADVGRVTLIIEAVAKEQTEQTKALAYIEGTMRNRAPRAPIGDHDV